MADIEYSNKYGVYLTKNGIKYLTNTTSIEVMNILETEAATLTDLSRMLEIPLSSAQSNMTKLSRENFVVTYKDEKDSRKTYYAPAALKVLESADPVDQISDAEEIMIKKLLIDNTDRHKTAIGLSSILPAKYGVSIGPLMEKAGTVIAYYVRDIFAGLDDDAFIEKLKDFGEKAIVPYVELRLEGGILSVKIHREDVTIDNALPVHRALIGFLMKAMSFHAGKTYCRKSMKISPDGSNIEVVIAPFNGKGTEILDELTTGMSRPDEYGCDPFAIYSLSTGSMLFANITQISVLDSLSNGNKTLKAMAEELDILPITLHVNLSKLMEVGAVTREDDSKNALYSLACAPLVTMQPKLQSDVLKTLEMMFISLNDDPSQYYKAALSYITLAYCVVGIGLDYVLRYTGSDVANVALDLREFTAQGFLDASCNMHIFGMKMEIESHIPLTFFIDVPDENKHMLAYAVPFMFGFVIRGLEVLTGMQYSVTFKSSSGTTTFYNNRRDPNISGISIAPKN